MLICLELTACHSLRNNFNIGSNPANTFDCIMLLYTTYASILRRCIRDTINLCQINTVYVAVLDLEFPLLDLQPFPFRSTYLTR